MYVVIVLVIDTQYHPLLDRLTGIVVKASAAGSEDPGFESRLRWDCFGIESNQ